MVHRMGMPIASLILDALFPDACMVCLKPKDGSFRYDLACTTCIRSVLVPDTPTCSTCGTGTSTLVPPCHPRAPVQCILGDPPGLVLQQLTTSFLYEHMARLNGPLGELLAATIVSSNIPLHRAWISPIPETTHIIRERGYTANTLLAQACAPLLGIELAPHLLSASRVAGRALYGIDTPGNAASADLLILIAGTAPSRSTITHLTRLVQAACPHAQILFLTCMR